MTSNSISRRLDALEARRASTDLVIDTIRIVGIYPDRTKPDEMTRAELCGVTYAREPGETEDAFLARVRALRPAGYRGFIMAH